MCHIFGRVRISGYRDIENWWANAHAHYPQSVGRVALSTAHGRSVGRIGRSVGSFKLRKLSHSAKTRSAFGLARNKWAYAISWKRNIEGPTCTQNLIPWTIRYRRLSLIIKSVCASTHLCHAAQSTSVTDQRANRSGRQFAARRLLCRRTGSCCRLTHTLFRRAQKRCGAVYRGENGYFDLSPRAKAETAVTNVKGPASAIFFKINLVRTFWMEGLTRTEPAGSRACSAGPGPYLPIGDIPGNRQNLEAKV